MQILTKQNLPKQFLLIQSLEESRPDLDALTEELFSSRGEHPVCLWYDDEFNVNVEYCWLLNRPLKAFLPRHVYHEVDEHGEKIRKIYVYYAANDEQLQVLKRYGFQLTLETMLADFDPIKHSGEAMISNSIGNEVFAKRCT